MNEQRSRRFRAASAGCIFFLLLCSYYILRPVRDEMGVQSGNAKLPWLFTATFIATLFLVPLIGAMSRAIPRRILVPLAFGFFVLNICGFYLSFIRGATVISAGTFFVWLSIFNLLAVSLFWSRMGDVFSGEDAKEFYGYISAGGTLGALVGPTVTSLLVQSIGTQNLLLISAGLLALATLLLAMIRAKSTHGAAIGGHILSGVQLTFSLPLRRIAVLVICYSTISTLVYMALLEEVGLRLSDSENRTAYFAKLDLITNLLTLALQTMLTGRLANLLGFKPLLTFVPGLLFVGILVLAFASHSIAPFAGIVSLMTLLAIVQTINRAGDYALMKPAREMIYATVDAERRYKAKSFIDTAVYRACDATGSWIISALKAIGASPLIFAGIPIALLWILTGYRTGKYQDEKALPTDRAT